VQFCAPTAAGTFVRRKAGDVVAGSVVAKAGERLTPAVIGLIASVGVGYVTVYNPLRVAIFFSGSELVAPGQPLPDGGIYNSNRYTLRALLKGLNCEVIDLGTVPDTLEKTIETMRRAAQGADVILSSGGMSVGEEDHIKPAIEALGHLNMWRVALKPGKPVALGEVAGVPYIGLPGNPVSSFVTFLMLARPYLLKCQGRSNVCAKPMQVRADFERTKPCPREEFVRVRRNDAGGLDIYPTQNSQILTSCAWADGLVDIPAGATVSRGDIVVYYPFGEMFN
ncbi:MAG: molybdopterin molybdotransferase MoeA, partial [Duodenibacillus sp.]